MNITQPLTFNKKKHHTDIKNKLDKLDKLTHKKFKVELKNEIPPYKNQQRSLAKISQLEDDISTIKDDLSYYIAENTIQKNPQETRDNIENLMYPYYKQLNRTKINRKFINLELNSNLHLFSQSSSTIPFTINSAEEYRNITTEYEYLKMEADTFISQVHNFVPLKSPSSEISEETYYQTISDALLDITNQRNQLDEMTKLEHIDDANILEEKITNTKSNLVKYINNHSENKDNNLISTNISSLLDQIYSTNLKIKSIDALMKKIEKETVDTLYNILKNESDNTDAVSRLSSTMASLEQNTASSNSIQEPTNDKLPLMLMPIRN